MRKKMAKSALPEDIEVPVEFSSPESSTIQAGKYDRETGAMTLYFSRGKAYDFTGIPVAVWAALVLSDSKGSHFNTHVRPLYPGVPHVEQRRA